MRLIYILMRESCIFKVGFGVGLRLDLLEARVVPIFLLLVSAAFQLGALLTVLSVLST